MPTIEHKPDGSCHFVLSAEEYKSCVAWLHQKGKELEQLNPGVEADEHAAAMKVRYVFTPDPVFTCAHVECRGDQFHID